MAGNAFGEIFRLTTFGESHGAGIGGVIDGCPAGLMIDKEKITEQMRRRKPGQSAVTTTRNESDDFEILSGLFEGYTTGAPIAFLIPNKDQRPKDYDNLKDVFRPSHADFVYQAKYGRRDHRGGGRSSARETAARVFAGSIARQLIEQSGMQVHAFVMQIGNIRSSVDLQHASADIAEQNIVRCPDEIAAKKMIELIDELRKTGDSTGGIVGCIIRGVPAGLGEPVFDKLHAELAKAMLSINAAHGFEYGSGFHGSTMRGSEHNDAFLTNEEGRIITSTNFSGGIQGGISNGMDIYFNVAFKPASTIMQTQDTVNKEGVKTTVKAEGRHDPTVLPRAVPVVEAMAALVLADHLLRNNNARIDVK